MKPSHRSIRRLPLLAAACALAPALLRAQLPAPAVSARAPVHVGAYGSVALRHAVRSDSAAGTGLNEAAAALLISGTLGKLSYFGEIEAASVTRENWTGREDQRWVEVERAYGEYAPYDALRIRAGRFLTPIGQWNETHGAPLTWTAGRPLTSYRPFAKSTTGLMAAGQLPVGPRDAGYALWVAPFDFEPRGEGEENTFVRAAGGRVAIEVAPDLYLGASAAGFRATRRAGETEPDDDGDDDRTALPGRRPGAVHRQTGDDGGDGEPEDALEEDATARTLLGADLSWRYRGFQLLSEAAWVSAADTLPAERGAFVQAAVPLVRGVHATGRFEVYDPVVTGPLRIWTAGLNWRPDPRLTLKAERQATDRPSRRVVDGWLVSLSVLF
ncbi:MAG TPA: hypothetical protein VFJ82_22945 [Longimicrobium sp.]|nr:hypothetical protein [Longimicrobium sp.]